jgi:tetratricopeptide (TPR) repeat protein
MPQASGYADRLIASSQARIKGEPSDYQALTTLGVAYLQKARETNDPTFYSQAEAALQKALSIKPDDYDALSALGSVHLSRHDFLEAEKIGMQAQRVNPQKSYAYGVIADAQIELGNYEQAIDTLQKMIDLKPNLASYSRVSYARELYGDVPGAIEAMQQAIQAGSPAAENTAWCRVYLGHLYLNSNQIDRAEQAYVESLAGYPDYMHAQAGLARVRWAQRRTDEAIELYKKSVSSVPLPEYLSALGDLYESAGNKAKAKEQYDLVRYIYQVFEANGVDVGIEKAAFMAEYDLDIPQALKLAEQSAQGRKDIHTQDTYAWTLYKAGRYTEALDVAQQAVRLGTQNATLHYHLGMIYQKLGDKDNARLHLQKALEINPYFSIRHSTETAKILNESSK